MTAAVTDNDVNTEMALSIIPESANAENESDTESVDFKDLKPDHLLDYFNANPRALRKQSLASIKNITKGIIFVDSEQLKAAPIKLHRLEMSARVSKMWDFKLSNLYLRRFVLGIADFQILNLSHYLENEKISVDVSKFESFSDIYKEYPNISAMMYIYREPNLNCYGELSEDFCEFLKMIQYYCDSVYKKLSDGGGECLINHYDNCMNSLRKISDSLSSENFSNFAFNLGKRQSVEAIECFEISEEFRAHRTSLIKFWPPKLKKGFVVFKEPRIRFLNGNAYLKLTISSVYILCDKFKFKVDQYDEIDG